MTSSFVCLFVCLFVVVFLTTSGAHCLTMASRLQLTFYRVLINS